MVPTLLMASTLIPSKLTKDNFLLCQTQLLPLLSNCDLNHILEEEHDTHSEPNLSSIEMMRPISADTHTSSQLKFVLVCVICMKTSKEVWEAIKKNYSSKSKSQIMKLHNKLHNIIKCVLSMDEYIKKIHTINKELTTAGQVMDKFVFTFTFL